MVLSRFWYVLLGLLLGLAVFVLSLATSMYNRAGARAMGEALSSDSQVVAWYLRDDARQRSGRLIQFGVDPDIAKYLQKSTDAENKVPEDARDKTLAALKKVNASIPKEDQFDAVFAVDQGGRVVAYLGYEQASGMADFELGGYPVVADALRGYVRDDTLILDRIYRVVARPVEYDTNALPAGAIIGARIVDDRFARELSSRTGAAIAFYAKGERASSGAPEGFPTGQLDQIVGDMSSLDQDPEYNEKGRSKVRNIGGNMLGVQYSRLPGEAWPLGGGFAVARLPVSVDGVFGFFKTADDKDKQQSNLPIAIGVAIAAAALGIFFSVMEHTRPISIFKSEAHRLAKGQIDQLQPSRFRGVFRKIASDLNDGMDSVLAKGGGPRRGPADMKQVLGDIPDQPQMSAFSFPGDPSSMASPPSGPSNPGVPSGPRSVPNVPVSPRLPRPPGRPGTPAAGLDSTLNSESADLSAPRRLPTPPQRAGDNGTSELAEWQAVYRDFVSLKQQCGENVDGFSYEKFEQTLKKKNEELMTRHGAKRVKFSVYVKEGKAALKASPIMD